MKKGKLLKRLAVAGAVVAIAGLSATVGTMAYYQSTGSYKIQGATGGWVVGITANNKAATDETVTLDTITMVPGDTKTISVEVDVSGTSAAGTVTVAYTFDATKPAKITVSPASGTSPVSFTAGQTNKVTQTITLTWPYGTDASDTTDAGKSFGGTLTVTVTQANPSA